jgi:TRAP-type uncharacterized transport system substrate-binding protein
MTEAATPTPGGGADPSQETPRQRDPEAVPTALKVAVVLGVLGLLVGGIASINLQPDLSHLDVTLLTGAAKGHYDEVGRRLSATAEEQKGTLRAVGTAGTVENVKRLVTHAKAPTVQFALVQDGLTWTEEQRKTLHLVARLPSSETVFFLGKNADRLQHFAELKGSRIGIGPEGSGTAQLARQVFSGVGFDRLELKLETHPIGEQLDLLAKGKLDLGVIVIDENSQLIQAAIGERKLQIASFPEVAALAERSSFLRAGRLHAGHYDPVGLVPPTEKHVLQVDTLVCGDGSASRSETVTLLQLLEEAFPGFLKHNQALPNGTGLTQAPVAEHYFQSGGPDLLDEYFPTLADWVPLSNLVHILMAMSILFNLMGAGHRFALWRVDATRVGLEARWTELFGSATTPIELEVRDTQSFAGRVDELRALAAELQVLKERCRKLSVSMLVPMGQELSYRFQETLINERLGALRVFMTRL